MLSTHPEPGSLREAVCVLVQRYRQEKELYLALAMLSPEGSKNRQEHFNQYRECVFPYISRSTRNEEKRIKSVLERSFARGPFKVKPS